MSSEPMLLGDRMKLYEQASRASFPPRTPVIIRVDGKAFKNFTSKALKPWDNKLISLMDNTAIALCKQISGAQMAYVQSDEISVFVHGYKNWQSQPWFDNQLQKMVSVATSIATAEFNMQLFTEPCERFKGPAYFDGRAFTLPEKEVQNYFVWRQQDATRNSVQMLARSLYSHNQLHGKKMQDLHDLCIAAGTNWNDCETRYKRGRCIVKMTENVASSLEEAPVVRSRWKVDNEIPIFSQFKEYVEKFLETEPT